MRGWARFQQAQLGQEQGWCLWVEALAFFRAQAAGWQTQQKAPGDLLYQVTNEWERGFSETLEVPPGILNSSQGQCHIRQ